MKESGSRACAYQSTDEDDSDAQDDDEEIEESEEDSDGHGVGRHTDHVAMSGGAMLDTSAHDGEGNVYDTDDDCEEEGVYDEEMSEHLLTEKDLKMNPRALLSLNGRQRVKTRAVFAAKLLTALNKAHQRSLQGKNELRSTTKSIVELWNGAFEGEFKSEKDDEMKKEMNEWRDETGSGRKSNGRRMSMELYKQESDDY
jgi:hypothetical protein